jgi:uncharacterized protein YneF (UPF0154 family)
MKDTLYTILAVLALVVGGIAGYAIGIHNMQRQAVANRAAHYEYVMNGLGDMAREFAWGNAE